MNLTCPAPLTKTLSRSARRLSLTVVTLCILLSAAVPGLAEPVRINQVVQTLTNSQGAPDLKLSTLVSSQDPAKGGTPPAGPRSEVPAQGSSQEKSESILSGVAITSEGQRLGVDIVEEGEVEGTICDCGDILVAGGAFPKWPLLFLAAVPLAFIDENSEEPTPTPTPTPPSSPTPTPPSNPTPTPTPPPQVPEPASLFLFGTGLVAFGAGLRRRYTKSKLEAQLKSQEEE